MNKTNLFFLFVIFAAISSCTPDDKKSLMPNSTGKAGEVLLIIEETPWQTKAGDLLKETFAPDIDGLPQPEPLFDLVNISSKAFSKFFQTHRNIVFTKIADEVEKSRITIENDVWAHPQIVIRLFAHNSDSMANLIARNKGKLSSLLLQTERKRLMKHNIKFEDIAISKKLNEEHNLKMVVPKGYQISMEEENFLWLSHEPRNIEQGILIYYYDFTHTNTFTKEYLIHKRDSILKKYVHGEDKGSYMTTEKELPVFMDELSHNDLYAIQMKGLWYLEKGFMGGPFISLTFVDEVRNRVVTAEGFVYSPKYDKRQYLRQVESIIYSLEAMK